MTRIGRLEERAARVRVEGSLTYNPGWHLALDLQNLLAVSGAVALAALERRRGRAPATTTRRTALRQGERGRPDAGRGALVTQEPLPMPPELEDAVRGEMTPGAPRVTRHDARLPRRRAGRGVPRVPGAVRGGHGRPRRHPPDPGDRGQRPAVPLELQGGKVRLLQRRGQRKPRLMCMTGWTSSRGRDHHRGAAQDVPGVKDLVTDVSFNYEVARQMPAFRPGPPGPTAPTG